MQIDKDALSKVSDKDLKNALLTGRVATDAYILGYFDMYKKGWFDKEELISLCIRAVASERDY